MKIILDSVDPQRIFDKFKDINNINLNKEYNDITLHHSSKSGISGIITPFSRKECDFGRGFYMGTSDLQTQSLVIEKEFSNPTYYKLMVKLSEIPDKNILFLNKMDWTYFVLYNRGILNNYKNTSLYKYYSHLADNKDIIIGPIADDNMRSALLDFEEGYITDKTLMDCLSSVDYGMQYVAKTSYACSKIEILEERKLDNPIELKKIREYSGERRNKGETMYREIRKRNLRTGNFLDELLEKDDFKIEIKNDNNIGDDNYERSWSTLQGFV